MGALSLLVNGLASAVTVDQTSTNGLSVLGTLTAPLLPKFLISNPLIDGFPWGDHNSTNTNTYEAAPDTGVMGKYSFTISRGILAPDGYEKEVTLVNGRYPGPMIEANWGDTIQVTVTKNISSTVEGA